MAAEEEEEEELLPAKPGNQFMVFRLGGTMGLWTGRQLLRGGQRNLQQVPCLDVPRRELEEAHKL